MNRFIYINKVFCYLLYVTLFLFVGNIFAEANLMVYFPSTESPKILEQTLKKGLKSKDVAVSVFAKYRDFEQELTRVNPDFIIANSAFSSTNSSYKPVQILNGNKSHYLVLGSKDWKKDKLSTARIGVVLFGDMDWQKRYINNLLDVKVSKFKFVNKSDDLIPLLVFDSVDVIVVGPTDYEKLKSSYKNSTFSILFKSKEVDDLSIYIKKDKLDDKSVSSIISGITNEDKKNFFSM
ncbi:MAG: hypothetical protein HQK51_03770 [Oligoflexia bacterium]|nr:hypothetical protein [Oligoflexia bacterium]